MLPIAFVPSQHTIDITSTKGTQAVWRGASYVNTIHTCMCVYVC